MCGQLPPNQRRSMTATLAPSSRALYAAASPAGPAPMIRRSKVVMWPQSASPSRRSRCRRASYNRTAAVTETLRLSATPRHRDADRPRCRRPSRHRSGRGPRLRGRGRRPPDRSTSVYGRDASTRAARIRIARPAARRGPRPSARPRAASRRRCPALARITFGLDRSVRGEAAITASAPAPSALRRTAPTLPGFSTPSMTTRSGVRRESRRGERERGRPDDGDEPLGTVAERELGEAPSRWCGGRATPAAASASSPSSAARASSPGEQRVADEGLDDLDARVERPSQLARAVDDRQTGRVPLASIAQGARPPGSAGWTGSRGQGSVVRSAIMPARSPGRYAPSARLPPLVADELRRRPCPRRAPAGADRACATRRRARGSVRPPCGR